MSPKTVLIVDDAESICQALAMLLDRWGHQTLVAFNGEEAVQMAKHHRPDLILLDLMMPVLDGWGALKQLRASPTTAGIPVIAITALRLSLEEVEAAGFDGYLEKPVAGHRLSDEIARLVEPSVL